MRFILLLALIVAGCDQPVTPPPVQSGNLQNSAISVIRADEHLAKTGGISGKDEHVVVARMLLAAVPTDLITAQKYINELYQHDQATGQVAETYKYRIKELNDAWFPPWIHKLATWILGISAGLLTTMVVLHLVTGGASTHLIIDAFRWLLRDKRPVGFG